MKILWQMGNCSSKAINSPFRIMFSEVVGAVPSNSVCMWERVNTESIHAGKYIEIKSFKSFWKHFFFSKLVWHPYYYGK